MNLTIKKIMLPLAVSFTLFLGACGGPANPNSSPEITVGDLKYHIEYLASDALEGRLSGTDGCAEAAEYIAAEFKAYGLEPRGDNGSYFQPFEVVLGVSAGDNRLEIKSGDKTESLAPSTDFTPVAFTENGTMEAEVIFAGYGISADKLDYDDYAGLDVKDKIVLVLRYSPEGEDFHSKFQDFASLRSKAFNAREKGAKGIAFFLGPEDGDDGLLELKLDVSSGTSGIQAVNVTRDVVQKIFEAAGKDLAKTHKAINENLKPASFATGVTMKMTTEVIQDRRTTDNVIGFLPGNDEAAKNRIVVVGAHYDHIGKGFIGSLAPDSKEVHNGADDNASGTAGVLEIAQKLAARRETLKHSYLFMAYSGEELGLLGSAWFVKTPTVDLENITCMINMDMIGRMEDNQLIVNGTGTSPVWPDWLNKLNEQTQFDLKLKSDGYGPSDQTSFYKKDIPVLQFFTGLHDDYNKPTDDADSINYEGEKATLDLVAALINEIDGQTEKLAFSKAGEAEQSGGRGGFRVTLGSIPDYAEEVEGVMLAGVRENSPAEKAGMKGGDIIIKFGDRDIKNIYDYTDCFRTAKPGDEVVIVVLRDGKELPLDVLLEGRK